MYGRSERFGLGRGMKYGLGGMPGFALICVRRSIGFDCAGASWEDGGCWGLVE